MTGFVLNMTRLVLNMTEFNDIKVYDDDDHWLSLEELENRWTAGKQVVVLAKTYSEGRGRW